MKKQIKMLLVALLLIPCSIMLVACGGNGNGGSSSIGTNPQIPSYIPSSVTSISALETAWEANSEFSEIQTGGTGTGMAGEYISATRTVGTKEYYVVATKYGAALAQSTFDSTKEAWDMAKQFGGESALKQALEDEGITNFNWDATGMSWKQDGYDYVWKIVGDWWFAQTPASY